MPNNLIVDVSQIQTAMSQISSLYTEASADKYNLMGQPASPLHVNQSIQCMRMETFVLNSTQFNSGWGTSTLSYDFSYASPFAGGPIAVASIHSNNLGLSNVNVVLYQERATNVERLLIYVNRLDKQAWVKNKESFSVHVIAIGY